MEKRELTCIGCPLGCPITVTIEQKEVTAVTGNTCPRGEAYARKEVTNPTRIVTSTVRVVGGTSAMVSCKTKEDVPKSKIFDVIEALRGVTVPAPVGIGDVLVRDVAGTKTDIVATKNVAVSSPE
jgi:CxxC motif-containing protein